MSGFRLKFRQAAGNLRLAGVNLVTHQLGINVKQPIDAAQIGDLFEHHAARLELYAAQWVSNGEDCVQEAFIELARQTEPPENPVAWLYRVVRNRALNAARSAQRRAGHERSAAVVDGVTIQANRKLELEEVRAHLEQMPNRDRELIVLRIWSDLTWKEISELTRMSTSAAHRHYEAALKKLKQKLEPSCQANLN